MKDYSTMSFQDILLDTLQFYVNDQCDRRCQLLGNCSYSTKGFIKQIEKNIDREVFAIKDYQERLIALERRREDPGVDKDMIRGSIISELDNSERRLIILNNKLNEVKSGDCQFEGCAFGRLLPSELSEAIDNRYLSGIDVDAAMDRFEDDDLMPSWILKAHDDDRRFFDSIQQLHDSSTGWVVDDNGCGLTKNGRSLVEKIVREQAFDKSVFTEYLPIEP